MLTSRHEDSHRQSFRRLAPGGPRRFGDFCHRGRSGSGDFRSAILKALPASGRDIIEIGMPFTDPMADGPAIQASGLRALKGGQTMRRTLGLVADFRKEDGATPLILMGYYNPIYIYGVDAFLRDAKAAGVDGLIVVDLPPEEDGELCLPALKAGLNFITAWRRRHRRQARPRCSPIRRASSTRIDHPCAHPPRRRSTPRVGARRCADQGAPSASWPGRLRHSASAPARR